MLYIYISYVSLDDLKQMKLICDFMQNYFLLSLLFVVDYFNGF